ncbi:MAG: hypothetical protein KAG96_03380 [Ichthyobacteriaceae bacterium]|nr:hypothetical protein [Ichthyobacteriaceae bacterium]
MKTVNNLLLLLTTFLILTSCNNNYNSDNIKYSTELSSSIIKMNIINNGTSKSNALTTYTVRGQGTINPTKELGIKRNYKRLIDLTIKSIELEIENINNSGDNTQEVNENNSKIRLLKGSEFNLTNNIKEVILKTKKDNLILKNGKINISNLENYEILEQIIKSGEPFYVNINGQLNKEYTINTKLNITLEYEFDVLN